MAGKSQWTTVGKRKLELSNLEKILYPEDHILKAEIIGYYLKIAPTILNHIKGRPLTLIRFPDGIHNQSFYQKNRPEWAPDWIEFVTLGEDERKDYILATEQASLVWLANLGALELHQMHCRKPHFDHPDYMVFDLDPPEQYDFKKVVELAFDLKDHIEGYGYHAFIKTTGGKGVHLVAPIMPEWDFSTVFEAAKDVATPFVKQHNKETTLQIKKEARKGRLLIDIYRNRQSQSIVSPYSLRGRPEAPVSMPLTWEELDQVSRPTEFNLNTVIDKVLSDGDAWQAIGAYATELHTHRSSAKSTGKLPLSGHYKSPEQLEVYSNKRDFTKTPEPGVKIEPGQGNGFVIHRHHATRLHYDLRLEQEGVLKSWAVPKGMPPRPGVKRLAVQTEDHPLEYLTFEGTIPKNQYGGGDMWIYALGRYEITKEKKNGFYFRLNSQMLSGEYRMHRTKEKEWLLEKVEEPQVDWLHDYIDPMQSESTGKPPNSDDYIYEIKWDGIRTLIALEDGHIRICTRNQNDVTQQFPELQAGDKAFRAACGLFDAEIVCLDTGGKPVFKKVINRLMSSGETTIKKRSLSNPVHCYVFDCLYLDGRSLINEPLSKRYIWLKDVIKKGTPYRVSEFMEDGESLFKAALAHDLEGIMAKKKDSRYLPGKRTDLWLKVKGRKTADCLIIGYTPGLGEREKTFGSLHIAEKQEEELQYRGKVGTGFDEALMKEIAGRLEQLDTIKKPVQQKAPDENISTWVEPKIYVEVRYARLTPDNMFREPVFVRLRPDLSI